MNFRDFHAALILALVNALLAALMILIYAHWFAPRPTRLATLDVTELYRLKEQQVATVLMKHDVGEAERADALKHAASFGAEFSQLLQSVSQQCACLILVQGAVANSSSSATTDLTPEVRRKLGL